MRILVIEDNLELNRQLCGYLRENHYDVLAARSEREAVNELRKRGHSIAIALVDLFLPAKAPGLDDRKSGLRLIELMTAHYPWVVSVVYTGYAELENAAPCLESGAFSCWPKGGDPDELLGVLSKAEIKYRKEQSARRSTGRGSPEEP